MENFNENVSNYVLTVEIQSFLRNGYFLVFDSAAPDRWNLEEVIISESSLSDFHNFIGFRLLWYVISFHHCVEIFEISQLTELAHSIVLWAESFFVIKCEAGRHIIEFSFEKKQSHDCCSCPSLSMIAMNCNNILFFFFQKLVYNIA